MSLSDESHGSGTEYGTVGYDKKRHGQLLLFPKSLKTFTDAKIVGIKYDLFAEDHGNDEEKKSPSSGKKVKKTKIGNRSPQRNRLQGKRPKRKGRTETGSKEAYPLSGQERGRRR